MFSITSISPNLSLFQAPSLFDIQLSKSLKHGNRFQKKKNRNDDPPQICKCFSTTYSTSLYFSHSKENPVANYANYANLLQSCSTVKEVKRIHAIVAKCVKSSGTFVYNNLIAAYVRMGKLIYAREVFDKMLERNVASWTAILSGYLRLGFEDEALRLYVDFVESGIQANSKTFVCLLNLCSRRLDFELGRQIHACVLKGNFSNLIVESAAMYFYAQCGRLVDAFCVFDRMRERDVVCWTTIITACSQHGQGEDAFAMFSQMLSDGFVPNEFTVCSVLKACGEEKALRFGRQLHGGIVKKIFRNDVFLGTSLVDMYAKCGEIEDSRTVFDGMRRRNMVTWTSIIAGYACNGFGEEAISLFRVMKR